MPTALLTPPTIDNDLTRRDLLAALAAGSLLTGCSPAGPSTPAAPATRTVTDLTGRTVDIPVEPRRIIALDPSRITSDLIALGLEPVGATTNDFNGLLD